MNDKVIILTAHPDDEVIFGWPVLAQAKRIICCSDDSQNPNRPYGTRRRDALEKVGKLVGAEVRCLPYPSEFYKVNAREGALQKLFQEVSSLVGVADGPIFTHNAWGEYGHMDHMLVHQLARMFKTRLIVTDIVCDAGWLPVRGYVQGKLIKKAHFDPELYARCEAIYRRNEAWTWSKDPVPEANLYEIN